MLLTFDVGLRFWRGMVLVCVRRDPLQCTPGLRIYVRQGASGLETRVTRRHHGQAILKAEVGLVAKLFGGQMDIRTHA